MRLNLSGLSTFRSNDLRQAGLSHPRRTQSLSRRTIRNGRCSWSGTRPWSGDTERRRTGGLFRESPASAPLGSATARRHLKKRPKSVDHRNLVPDSVAQHSDAVSGFFRVQPRRNAGYIMRIESSIHMLYLNSDRTSAGVGDADDLDAPPPGFGLGIRRDEDAAEAKTGGLGSACRSARRGVSRRSGPPRRRSRHRKVSRSRNSTTAPRRPPQGRRPDR